MSEQDHTCIYVAGSDLLCGRAGLQWGRPELYRDLPAGDQHLDQGTGPACNCPEPPGHLNIIVIVIVIVIVIILSSSPSLYYRQ